MINLVIEKIRNIKAKTLSFDNNYIEFLYFNKKKFSIKKISEVNFFLISVFNFFLILKKILFKLEYFIYILADRIVNRSYNSLNSSLNSIKIKKKKKVLILGNSPDVKKINLNKLQNKYDLFVVNNFALSNMYKKLNVKYYLIIHRPIEDLEKKRDKFLKKKLNILTKIKKLYFFFQRNGLIMCKRKKMFILLIFQIFHSVIMMMIKLTYQKIFLLY